MSTISQLSAPHYHMGGQGPALHFAAANGYPPGTYRAFLEPFTENHEVVASLHRPLWEPPPELASFRSWDVFGDDICELVGQLPHPVVSVGHSMGTAAILLAAVQRPELFKSLVLIEPVLVPRRYLLGLSFIRRFRPEVIPMVKRALSRVDRFSSRQEAFDHYRPKRVFQQISDAVLWDYVQHGTKEIAPGEFALTYSRDWEARCYTLVHNLWRLLPHLKVPTLAIRAQGSHTLGESCWNKWQSISSNVDFIEIEGAGHLVPFEKPEQLASIILDWIES
ncbi:MAG: alpha/beta hydrolase [Gammaproteobacteria bacterium]|nr:alpha/beta hydrolase [Gammaproteobacteria bacterium]